MTLLNEIDAWIKGLYREIELGKIDELGIIKQIRSEENNESSLLFYFLIERFLLFGLKNKKIVASKGILKYYLNSKYKEYEDYLFYGNKVDEEVEKVSDEVYLRKGIFIKIIELLNLQKTKHVYIDYLFSTDEEFNKIKNKKTTLDDVIKVLFREFDEKDFQTLILNFENDNS